LTRDNYVQHGRDMVAPIKPRLRVDTTASDRRVRRRFRALYDQYPGEVTRLVRDIQLTCDSTYASTLLPRAEARWLDHFPPIGTRKVSRGVLAMLLADYRNAQARKIRQQEFLDTLADQKCRFGDRYFEGTWDNAETIRSHLRAARKLAKKDPQFEAEVQFCEKALAQNKISSAGWGEIGG
jgi:hypothetical protein